MSQIAIDGTIVMGPVSASDEALPKGVVSINLETTPSPKPSTTQIKGSRSLNSSGAFVDTGWVGAGKDVTQGNFLYIRSDADTSVRITTDDGAGGNVVAVFNIEGMLLMEFPLAKFLKLVELKGVAGIEYIVSGDL